MNGLLILLCMVGWALYVVDAHSTDSKGVQAQNSQSSAKRLTVGQGATPSEKSELQPLASAAKQSPHAITPDETPRQEPANSSAPPPQIPTTENTKPPLEVDQKLEVRSNQPEEQLRVTRETSIRSGPSDSSQLIGRAHRGATLRAKSREAGWVQFVDPIANETGWISMAYLQPSDAVGDASEPPKSEKVKTPKTMPQMAKLKPPKPPKPGFVMRPTHPSYSELPADREFVPPRRSGLFGLFWRRRFSADEGR
jgi:hypothetical protein